MQKIAKPVTTFCIWCCSKLSELESDFLCLYLMLWAVPIDFLKSTISGLVYFMLIFYVQLIADYDYCLYNLIVNYLRVWKKYTFEYNTTSSRLLYGQNKTNICSLPMTGFKLGSSGVRSDHCATTTTVHCLLCRSPVVHNWNCLQRFVILHLHVYFAQKRGPPWDKFNNFLQAVNLLCIWTNLVFGIF